MNFTIGLYGPRSSSIILFWTQVQPQSTHVSHSIQEPRDYLSICPGVQKGTKAKVSKRVQMSTSVSKGPCLQKGKRLQKCPKGSKRVQGDQRYDRVHIVVSKIVKKCQKYQTRSKIKRSKAKFFLGYPVHKRNKLFFDFFTSCKTPCGIWPNMVGICSSHF